MEAWKASVGYSLERVWSQRFVTHDGTYKEERGKRKRRSVGTVITMGDNMKKNITCLLFCYESVR